MSGFTIRDFVPGDGEALSRAHQRAILATADQFYSQLERESWAYGLEPDLYRPKEGGVIEVATDPDGHPIAFCDSVGDEILGLYVDPDWQGRGVGSKLLGQAEAMMLERGHATARVKSTTSAQPFYEAHGYRFAAAAPHKTRGGLVLPAVAMEKPIVTSR